MKVKCFSCLQATLNYKKNLNFSQNFLKKYKNAQSFLFDRQVKTKKIFLISAYPKILKDGPYSNPKNCANCGYRRREPKVFITCVDKSNFQSYFSLESKLQNRL